MGKCRMKRVHVIYGQGDLDITCTASIAGPQEIKELPENIQKLFEQENCLRVCMEFSTNISDLNGFVIYTKMEG